MNNPVVSYILQNPLPFLAFMAMLIYILKSKYIHALYVYAVATFGYFILQKIGITEFMSGIFVGVLANQIFDFIKTRLKSELKSSS